MRVHIHVSGEYMDNPNNPVVMFSLLLVAECPIKGVMLFELFYGYLTFFFSTIFQINHINTNLNAMNCHVKCGVNWTSEFREQSSGNVQRFQV